MEILKKYSDEELLLSMRAEIKRAMNELDCAKKDIGCLEEAITCTQRDLGTATARLILCLQIITELRNERGNKNATKRPSKTSNT